MSPVNIDWSKVVTTILISAIIGGGSGFLIIKSVQLDHATLIEDLQNVDSLITGRLEIVEKGPEVVGLKFGEYRKMDIGREHIATKDGIVIARINASSQVGSGIASIEGYTHQNADLVKSNSESALRSASTVQWSSIVSEKYGSFVMPVKRDDHWKVFFRVGAKHISQVEVFWMPLEVENLSNPSN